MVRQLLEQEGMTAFVNGGFLEGGAGELPMGGLATVSVADEHEARALEVVREWESLPVPPRREVPLCCWRRLRRSSIFPPYSTPWARRSFFRSRRGGRSALTDRALPSARHDRMSTM
ncbi:hypothetical protein D3C86_1945100 [compost metagenome]